jgi:proteasome lid subunit RPN8/RPN11
VAGMKLTKGQIDELIAHARDEDPYECCGMIGSIDGEAKSIYKARNAEQSALRYNMDPSEQIKIMNTMEERGEEIGAIYHSHTKSPAYPSQTDINLAAYPDSLYVIVSLLEGEEPVRGFHINDGHVEEAKLDVG